MPSQIILIENSDELPSAKPTLALTFPGAAIKIMGRDMKALNFFDQPAGNMGSTLVVINLDLGTLEGMGFIETFTRTAMYAHCRVVIFSEPCEQAQLSGMKLNRKTQIADRGQSLGYLKLQVPASSLTV